MNQQEVTKEIIKPKPCQNLEEDDFFIYKIQEYKTENLSQMLSYMIVRPPRFLYNQQLLIPSFRLEGRFIYNEENIPFPLSIYRPNGVQMKYIILYLHGNTSSRFQGYMQLMNLPRGVGLACFDFNGCGNRLEADFITLGKNQSKEVNQAAKFLKQKGYKVVGWGRSMGSVSLLLSQECDIMVADSPFSSLEQLCKQTGQQVVPTVCCGLFHCFYPCVECWLRKQVHKLSGLDTRELQVIEKVKNLSKEKSLLIISGQQDTMIGSHHSQQLYEAFTGTKKKLILFPRSHNENRPMKVLKQCFQFINQQLNVQVDLSCFDKNIERVTRVRMSTQNKNVQPDFDSQRREVTKTSENYIRIQQHTTTKNVPKSLNVTVKPFEIQNKLKQGFDRQSMPSSIGSPKNNNSNILLLKQGNCQQKQKNIDDIGQNPTIQNATLQNEHQPNFRDRSEKVFQTNTTAKRQEKRQTIDDNQIEMLQIKIVGKKEGEIKCATQEVLEQNSNE